MKAARSMSVPVSVLMGWRAPGEKWTDKDTILALALQQYEDGLCRGCGQPLALALHNDEHTGRGFEIESFSCTSCAELESVSEDTRRNDEPGTKRTTYLVNV